IGTSWVAIRPEVRPLRWREGRRSRSRRVPGGCAASGGGALLDLDRRPSRRPRPPGLAQQRSDLVHERVEATGGLAPDPAIHPTDTRTPARLRNCAVAWA